MDIVKLLIANHADVNIREMVPAGSSHYARDIPGPTLLHKAAATGQLDMIKFLLANKADVNARDDENQTPLDVAEHENRKDAADLLRQNGGTN